MKTERVCAAVLDVMELGEPDASGRRRPVETGKTITVDCDQVIVAVGVSPNPLVPKSVEGLELGRKNTMLSMTTCRVPVPRYTPEVISYVVVPPLSSQWAMVGVQQPAWLNS